MPTWSKARVQTYSVNECTMHDGCGEVVDSYRDICGDPPLVAELSKLRQVRQTEADGGARDEGSAVLLVE